MIAIADMLLGGAVPAIVAAATMVVAWRIFRNSNIAWLGGLTLGFLAGFWGMDARGAGLGTAVSKAFQPAEARDWLPCAILAAAFIEALSYWPRCPAWVTWLLRVLWCCFLPWRLLAGSVYLPATEHNTGFDTGAWSTIEALVWLGCASGLLALCWWLMRSVPAREQPRLRSSLTSLVALGATLTITLSGSLTVGQLLGVLTAALVGCGMVAAVLRFEHGPEAAAGPLLAIYGGGLLIARFLLSPELSVFATLMLMAALIAAVARIYPPRWLAEGGHGAVRIAVCLIALALTVIPAAREFAASQAERANDPYFNLQQ